MKDKLELEKEQNELKKNKEPTDDPDDGTRRDWIDPQDKTYHRPFARAGMGWK